MPVACPRCDDELPEGASVAHHIDGKGHHEHCARAVFDERKQESIAADESWSDSLKAVLFFWRN